MYNRRKIAILCLAVPPLLGLLTMFLYAARGILLYTANTTLTTACNVGLAIVGPVALPSLIVGLPTGLYLLTKKSDKPTSASDKSSGFPAAAFAIGFILLLVVATVFVSLTGGV